jgi:hypothetical protein
MLAATLRRIAGGLSAPVTVAEEAPALQLLDS